MDYVINVNGIDIVVESHTSASRQKSGYEQRNRLMSYYKQLLKMKGIDSDSERQAALYHVVDSMTEQSAAQKANNFEQARLDRLIAYATKFAELKLKHESPDEADSITKDETAKVEKMADALIEVLDAVAEDDAENLETVDINGNKFVYEKGTLNIRDYVLKLYDIGEQIKGNTWTIYLDDEGELVIY